MAILKGEWCPRTILGGEEQFHTRLGAPATFAENNIYSVPLYTDHARTVGSLEDFLELEGKR